MGNRTQHVILESLPKHSINDKLNRQMLFGKEGNIGLFTLKKGTVVPLYYHVNEQFSMIMKGSVKVSIAGKDYIVKAGEIIVIPSNVPHRFEALEDDTYDIDFFSPLRKDWLDGSANYSSNK